MPNFSDEFADRVIGHRIDLSRVGNEMQTEVLGMLGRLEKSLVADLATSDPTRPVRQAYQQARLEALLKQTRETIATAYKDISKVHAGQIVQLSGIEAAYTMQTANSIVGANVMSVAVSKEQLEELAKNTLIEKAPSATWWKRQGLSLQERFTDNMRQGVLRGETLEQLTKRVRGSKEKKGTDGIMHASKREAEALVRTSVQTVSNEAQLATYRANRDVVKGIQWVATLDTRTTLICRALDGLQWDVDGKPIGHERPFPGPTAHWGCRSTQITILKSWEELAEPGSIPAAEPGKKKTDIATALDKELAAQGFNSEERAKIKQKTRASMDGQVAQDIGMDKWVAKKPKATQDKMLGKGRADLFREGKITLTDLVNQNGRPLKLDELRTKIGQAGDGRIDPLSGLPRDGFVDMLYQKGGRTKKDIFDLTMKRFPKADPEETWRMVERRPEAIRSAGGEPVWLDGEDPEFAKRPKPAKTPEPAADPKAPNNPEPAPAPKPEPPKLLTEERVTQAGDRRQQITKDKAADVSAKGVEKWGGKLAADRWQVLPKAVKEMSSVAVVDAKTPTTLYRPALRELHMAPVTKTDTWAGASAFYRAVGNHVAAMSEVVTSVKTRDDFGAVLQTMRSKRVHESQGLTQSLFRDLAVVTAAEFAIDVRGITDQQRRDVIDQFAQFHDVVAALTLGRYGSGHTEEYLRSSNRAAVLVFAHAIASVYVANRFIEKFYPEAVAWAREFLGFQ